MTHEQMRIAIAKRCRYCFCTPNDLNAMHEAEKVLETMEGVHEGDEDYSTYYFNRIRKNSNAYNRAMVFLETFGDWKD